MILIVCFKTKAREKEKITVAGIGVKCNFIYLYLMVILATFVKNKIIMCEIKRHPSFKDPTGEKYNRFTIAEFLHYKVCGGKKEKVIRAICDCGNERIVEYRDLKRNRRKSCGCINEENKIKVNTGDIYGLWTVLSETDSYVSPKGEKERAFLCKCVCGKEKPVNLSSLRQGISKSCGCQGRVKEELPPIEPKDENIFKNFTKGTSWKFKEQILTRKKNGSESVKVIYECKCGNIEEKSYLNKDIKLPLKCSYCYQSLKYTEENFPGIERLKRILSNMKARCRNPNTKDYYLYGAKGIDVCKEWDSLKNFYNWSLDNNYKEDLTINRKDPDKGYNPENCEWVSKHYNSINNSKSKLSYEDAEFIRDNKDNYNIEYFCERYSVSKYTIKHVLNFKTWRKPKEFFDEVSVLNGDL